MRRSEVLDILAGTLLLLSLGLVGAAIIWLGERPALFGPAYNLTASFPDASGLSKGSDVYACGALIGKVTTDPEVVPGTDRAEVALKIDQGVKIRRDAIFSVSGSGFASDKFVEVSPKKLTPGEPKAPFLTNGEVITGVATPSLQSLESSARPLILRSRHIAAQVDNMVTTFNKRVLTQKTVESLKATVVGFKTLTATSDQTAGNARGILTHIKSGHGALGRLLYDKSVRRNLSAFMTNLQAYDPLFYRDAPEEASSSATETETPRERYEGN
jgi:ABC-type transporter Mla subunit MlaD